MRTFLRRLRKKLLDEGHLRKYILYAVGEIFLVVIGILIALQLNNLNEEGKRSEEGQQILAALKQNSESNIQRLQQENEIDQNVIRSIEIVIDNLTITKAYHDSLDKHFAFSVYWPETRWKNSAYEALKNKGLDLIASDSLQKKVIDVYDGEYQRIQEAVRTTENYAQAVLYSHFSEHFRIVQDRGIGNEDAKPTDYDELVQSQEYVNFMSFWRLLRQNSVEVRSAVIAELEALNMLITDELKK